MNNESMSGWNVQEMLKRGFFTIVFQPVIELKTNRIHGYEALFRGPREIPMVEPAAVFHNRDLLPNNVLLDTDIKCIEKALQLGRHLPENSLLFINVHHLTLKHLSENEIFLRGLLDNLRINPSKIVFEISENTMLTEMIDVRSNVAFLRKMGANFALDDIGLSSAWLQNLLLFEPQFAKVDRTIFSEVEKSKKKKNLLNGLVVLSQTIGLSLIVEGVETEEEFSMIKEIGVQFAQGYFLGIPRELEYWISGAHKEERSFPALLECGEEDC
ncbi:MAG: EAL domain-containing protein [Thermoanaerobaculaceae bacterium]|nr:EAL domain-containing protein [Thermoanaerobaculaceae bacterium]